MSTTKSATQGHTYTHLPTGRKVMAMSGGEDVEVRVLDFSRPWPLTTRMQVDATHLQPLPMTYFNYEVPR